MVKTNIFVVVMHIYYMQAKIHLKMFNPQAILLL